MDGLGAGDADQESVAVVEVDSPDFVGLDASSEFFDEISSFAGEDADDGSLLVRNWGYTYLGWIEGLQESVKELVGRLGYFFGRGSEVVSFEIEAHAADVGVMCGDRDRGFVGHVVQTHFPGF